MKVYRENEPQYAKTLVFDMPVATNSTLEIVKYSLRGLDRIYKSGYNFTKGGVMVSDIVPEAEVQGNLFDQRDREADKNLMTAMDKLNKSFGKDIVQVGARGQRKNWLMRADYKSPCYTTRLNELLTVRV